MRFRFTLAAAAALAIPSFASAQVGLDGLIGAEWTGVNPVLALYDPAAPTSNFGSPTNKNHVTGYEIFMRRDANWLYTAFRTTGGMNSGGLMFANLYFSLRSGPGQYGNSGSSIAFEVTNDRAFKPGGACCFNDNGSNLLRFATTSSAGNPDILESAIDLSVFFNNALNVTGYVVDPNAVGVRLNLSQTFGYSVVGGPTYGDPTTGPALGFVSAQQSVVPEPSTYALMCAGLAAMAVTARRRRKA